MKKTTPALHPARLLPERMLPPYSYVPGKFPHPLRDPQGHSFGHQEPTISTSQIASWDKCESYLWGIDLFNYGYYWEAHEAWEALWHAVGRSGTTADFCKGLIKLAAAGVKAREGRTAGVERHALRAKQLFDAVAAQLDNREQRFMGLALQTRADHAQALIDNPSGIIDTSDAPVVVVMPFAIEFAADPS